MESKIDLVKGFPEELYKEGYAEAKSTQICVRCGGPVLENSNRPSRIDYRISALCESCRDQIIYRCLHRDQEPDPS